MTFWKVVGAVLLANVLVYVATGVLTKINAQG